MTAYDWLLVSIIPIGPILILGFAFLFNPVITYWVKKTIDFVDTYWRTRGY